MSDQVLPHPAISARPGYIRFERSLARHLLDSIWIDPGFKTLRSLIRDHGWHGFALDLFTTWGIALRIAEPSQEASLFGEDENGRLVELKAHSSPLISNAAQAIHDALVEVLSRTGFPAPTRRQVFHAATFLVWPSESTNEAWEAYADLAGWQVNVPSLAWHYEPELPNEVRRQESADFAKAFEPLVRQAPTFVPKFTLQGRPRLENDSFIDDIVQKAIARKKKSPSMTWPQVAAWLGVPEDTLKRWRKNDRERKAKPLRPIPKPSQRN